MKVVSKANRIMDLRGYYQWSVESRRCPYVVSGSAVSLIFREIISKGPLLGRFSPRYVEGLEEKYVIELCDKLGALLNIEVPEELGIYLHQYTAGCPYYIKQFLQTSSSMLRERKEKELTREVLGNAITYELTTGQIWHDLEEQITSYFSLNEWGIVRTLLFLATKFEDTFDIAYLAKEVNISETEVREILSRLARADLISDDFGVFRNVQDPVLLRFLEIQYRLEIEGFRDHKRELMDKEYRKQIRLLKSKIGILFEYKLRELMRNWDDREVDGALFNTKEKVKLQKFDYVKEEWIKVQGSRLYQIDAYGSTVYPDATQAVWLVESKCQKNPIGTSEVKKFEN
ncbi:MAG TPA: hypothetical protein EYP22_11285 [Methanosarcinales archaeon]|nr:hypothetical protein [Methanosarcinales archaeon]